jgi:trehalose 6-phosphate phosphatase
MDAAITVLTARPERTALLLDFDGSLAPIVERADAARALPDALVQLRRLVRVLGRVGIVSGRPVGFLVEHVPVEGVVFTGLYGMEHVVGGERTVDPRVEPYVDAVAAAVEKLAARFPADVVEPKSGVSVTLHWRPAPDRRDEILEAGEAAAKTYGLAPLRTRMAIELRPPIAIDKGDAARGLVDGFDVAAFAGDDTGDLPAFAALADAVARGELRHAVRIGVSSPEAPPELLASVDMVVPGPDGLVRLLARVADEIA